MDFTLYHPHLRVDFASSKGGRGELVWPDYSHGYCFSPRGINFYLFKRKAKWARSVYTLFGPSRRYWDTAVAHPIRNSRWGRWRYLEEVTLTLVSSAINFLLFVTGSVNNTLFEDQSESQRGEATRKLVVCSLYLFHPAHGWLSYGVQFEEPPETACGSFPFFF